MATKDMKDSKAAALETAIAQIEKQCGKGSIMRLGDNTRMGPSIDSIPTTVTCQTTLLVHPPYLSRLCY